MSDDKTIRAILEFVTKGNEEFVRDLIEADRGAQQVASSLKKATEAQKANSQSLQIGSRNYRNVSTAMDDMISAKEREGKAFSNSLRAQMQNNAALEKAAQRSQDLTSNLPRLRYALYDVSQTLGLVSAALGVATAGVVVLASRFESSFTDVERTTLASGQNLESIRKQLLGLAREIPLAFGDITTIASLGAQLGIADSDLAGFAETVAQFSATTNVSAENAAQSFGALGELLNVSAAEYVNLGSAIALVGINSVATESEILSVSTQIAGVGASAGLSADFVIGLSGALASLRVPPEQSRGALTRVFQEINRAAAEGGESLDRFAQVLGVTSGEAALLARTDIEGFFRKFIGGLGNLNTQQLTTTLDDLNLAELRVTNTLTRLSRNLELVDSTIADSNDGFANGTFLAEVYGRRVDDIASRFQILVNSLAELGATAGSALLPIVGPILDALASIAQALSNALGTEAGQALAAASIAAGVFAAALIGLTATSALTIASMAALKTAIIELGWTSATGGARGLAAGLVGVGTAANGAAVGVRVFRTALITTGVGAVVALLGTLAAGFIEVGESADLAFQNFFGSTAGLADAVVADTAEYQAALEAGNTRVAESFALVKSATDGTAGALDENAQRVFNAARVLGEDMPSALDKTKRALEETTFAIGDNTTAWIRNQLIQSDAFQDLVSRSGVADTLVAIGFDIQAATAAAAENGEQGLRDYYLGLAEAAFDAGKVTIDQIAAVDGAIAAQIAQGRTTGDIFSGGLSGPRISPGQVLGSLNPLNKSLLGLTSTVKLLGVNGGTTANVVDNLASEFDSARSSADNLGSSVNRQLRTVLDYASDLQGVFSRAFDLRFGNQNALDTVASGWMGIADATEAANKKIRDFRDDIRSLQADIQGLTADRAIQEYFLSVANAYGDTLRAGAIAAKIAKIDADLADKRQDLTEKNEDLSEAQQEASKTLVGNSKAAIANRKTIQDMVKSYQAQIIALAESGASQSELESTSRRLRDEFVRQATQLGFSRQEVETYAMAFDDVTQAIQRIPRNVDVEVSGLSPALAALTEFQRAIGNARRNASGGVNVPLRAAGANVDSLIAARRRAEAERAKFSQMGEREAANAMARTIALIQSQIIALRGYSSGGFTGRGGKYQPAGVVHKGEYVIPKEGVNQSTGLPYADALGRTQMGSRPAGGGYSRGGFVAGGGAMMVELSPTDRRLLAQAAMNPDVVVAVDSKEIARASANGAKQITATGGRLS